MSSVTLKQLRYFDALAREKHFGRAAATCSVSQPALSMQIQDLEATLRVALVERTRGGLRLTQIGAKIAARAARILSDAQDLIDVAQHSEQLLTGPLSLGVIPSIAPYMLPPMLPILKETYPELELQIRETQTAPLTEELIKGQLDVMLLAMPIEHPDVETLDLFDDHFLLAIPKGRKLSARVKATPELIQDERLLLLEEGHCLRDQALRYCGLREVEAIRTFGASSLTTIVEMVSAGLGITLLPEMCQGVEQRSRDIQLLRFAPPEPSRKLGLAWRKTSPRRGDFIELGRLLLKARNSMSEKFKDITDDPAKVGRQSPKTVRKAKTKKRKGR
ncbi:MAG: hydrogen peroxide-inducible genes activator [Hyphomicrobiaceae bacterium]